MRRNDREIKEMNEILALLDGTPVLHLGLHDGDYPYIVPLHYGYEKTEEGFVFYCHSAREGHKLDLITADGRCFVELENNISQVSGEDNPCMYSSTFASFMGKGKASLLSSDEEKEHALKVLMAHQTGRNFEFTDKMVKAVTVIAIDVTEYSVKAKK